MKTAIVILNWNGKSLLAQFLPSIESYSSMPHVKLYVVDNASTDDSVAFLQSSFPKVQLIQNSRNRGYAGGYNDALQQIDADLFVLVNSDIEVSRDWLLPILQQFENEPNTGIVQPKICNYFRKDYFEYAGAAGGFIDALGYPYCRGRIFESLEKDEGQFNDITDIFWASGACLFIRSSLFFDLNGFDENYFAHQEEIDLCWRVKNSGFDIRYNGNSIVYHIGGATLKEAAPRKTFLNFRNSLFTNIKNQSGNQVIQVLLLRMILDGIAGIKFLFELRPVHTIAIIRAHFSFYWYLPGMIKKRRNIYRREHNFGVRSIVWKYFILGKKKVKDL